MLKILAILAALAIVAFVAWVVYQNVAAPKAADAAIPKGAAAAGTGGGK